MVYLTDLARLLGTEQTLYGMRYRGLDGEAPPDATVEQIAGRMVDAIRSVQGCGPYRLAGHCFGGLVAFEIARRLSHQGLQIRSLAILNTPAPLAPPAAPIGDPGQARWIHAIARACEDATGKHVPLVCDLNSLDDEAQLCLLRRAMIAADLLPAEAELNQIRGLVNVFRANSSARYRPDDILDVPITLLRATDTHPQFDYTVAEDPGVLPLTRSTLGWKWLSKQPVVVHTIPGNHLTMLNTPNIDAIGEALHSCLAYREEEFCAWESD
jgi:thioesterase domain-containing protein